VRKGLEVYYTVLIEVLWSKKRIIEEYLNVAEMGKGIYGVQAAAEKYFKKNAAKINIGEAAIIAAILPNPKKRNPNRPTGYLLGRKSTIMKQMNAIGGIGLIRKNTD
jgi:monofunctional biosynthetic peptidoglycan transglycosylase